MNLEKANLDELLIRNAIPQFIADLEAALQKNIENKRNPRNPPHDFLKKARSGKKS